MSPPMPSPREHLAALLAPVGIDEFLSSAWEQRALHIPGSPGKFSGWEFDVDALRDMLEDHPDLTVKAQYYDPGGHHREVEIEPEQAFALFDAGLTICFQSIEGCHDALRELAVACKTYLNLAEQFFVNCYWSPSAGGFGMHLDRFSVLIVQLDGTKHWTYSETPAIPFPLTNFTDIPEGRQVVSAVFPWMAGPPPFAEECRLAEQTLVPGDALYLPAGTWHRAQAGGILPGPDPHIRPPPLRLTVAGGPGRQAQRRCRLAGAGASGSARGHPGVRAPGGGGGLFR